VNVGKVEEEAGRFHMYKNSNEEGTRLDTSFCGCGFKI
jgi:hypothetical protein